MEENKAEGRQAAKQRQDKEEAVSGAGCGDKPSPSTEHFLPI